MEQIPNNSIEGKLPSDYEITKKDFKKYFSNLMESNKSILNQTYELCKSKLGDISESQANIAINDEIKNIINSFFQNKFTFIVNELKKKLESIIEDYSTTVLNDLFDTLISLWIQKNRKKKKIVFYFFRTNLCSFLSFRI